MMPTSSSGHTPDSAIPCNWPVDSPSTAYSIVRPNFAGLPNNIDLITNAAYLSSLEQQKLSDGKLPHSKSLQETLSTPSNHPAIKNHHFLAMTSANNPMNAFHDQYSLKAGDHLPNSYSVSSALQQHLLSSSHPFPSYTMLHRPSHNSTNLHTVTKLHQGYSLEHLNHLPSSNTTLSSSATHLESSGANPPPLPPRAGISRAHSSVTSPTSQSNFTLGLPVSQSGPTVSPCNPLAPSPLGLPPQPPSSSSGAQLNSRNSRSGASTTARNLGEAQVVAMKPYIRTACSKEVVRPFVQRAEAIPYSNMTPVHPEFIPQSSVMRDYAYPLVDPSSVEAGDSQQRTSFPMTDSLRAQSEPPSAANLQQLPQNVRLGPPHYPAAAGKTHQYNPSRPQTLITNTSASNETEDAAPPPVPPKPKATGSSMSPGHIDYTGKSPATPQNSVGKSPATPSPGVPTLASQYRISGQSPLQQSTGKSHGMPTSESSSAIAPPQLPPRKGSLAASRPAGFNQSDDPQVDASSPNNTSTQDTSPNNQTNAAGSAEITSTRATGGPIPSGSSASSSVSSVVKPVKAAQYRLYMEQHVEQVVKSQQEREERKNRLEAEMAKVGLNEAAMEQMRKLLKMKETNYIRMLRKRMHKSMFEKIAILGVGAFGEVALVRKKDNGQIYAMKKLQKLQVVQKKQTAHVRAERDILAEADNEWVVKLFFSFQDEQALYLVMEYIAGGDLMSLLIKKGIFEEDLARFYMAELTLALERVHSLGFIHRDIKPDNILITTDGHIKLTDFGLCTGFRWTHMSQYYQHWDPDSPNHAVQESVTGEGETAENNPHQSKPLHRRRYRYRNRRLAHSLVGTPNYIAPEILRREPYSNKCDWWSVGVILYEMLVGQPPFLANNALHTQYRVIKWRTELRIPERADLSPEARDIILKFCRDPDDRLSDPAKIKQHSFFRAVNWELLPSSAAPYIPQVKHELDISNFDPVDEDKVGSSEEDDNGDSSVEGNEQNLGLSFPNFTFKRFFDRDPP